MAEFSPNQDKSTFTQLCTTHGFNLEFARLNENQHLYGNKGNFNLLAHLLSSLTLFTFPSQTSRSHFAL